jgi:hypothetical protein
MQIQINTDSNIQGDERLGEQVEAVVRRGLGHFSTQITRLEVHLSDQSSDQKSGGEDKRCLLEARPAINRSQRAIRERRSIRLWTELSRS